MRRVLQRFPSLLSRNFLQSPATSCNSKIQPYVVPLLDRSISQFVVFSSESDSARAFKTEEVVSKEEMKKRIEIFLDDGDEDAIPDLFEALMIRKLSGEHDESDDELMEVVRKYPVNKVDDTDSDIGSDDGLRVGDSSDSDIEFDGLKDIDLSLHNIKIDGRKADPCSDYDSESD